MRSSELSGKRVAILGTGREGKAAVDALAGIAELLLVSDDGDEAWGLPVRHDLDGVGVDIAVKSPGIPPSHPVVRALLERGVSVTSGTDLWMGEHASATTGVTGSKGKSTTASLIHALTPGSVLGGNIGVPLLALEDADRYVVELSSYQCQSLTVSPDVAVVTSLFPEHLDWHGSEEQYYSDKLNIVRHGPRRVFANGEDARLRGRLDGDVDPAVEWVGGDARYRLADRNGVDWITRADEPIMPVTELKLLGRHNALNATLALAAADAVLSLNGNELPADDAAERLASFVPLEHRLEPIPDASGLTFVNDSLSTSPFAAIEALRAFPGGDVTLLVGGQDRGVDYAPLAEYLVQHPIAAVVGLPSSGARILGELQGVHTQLASDMRDAVARARVLTPAGGTVLLSPAAPSYGIYRDFAERAADFRAAIAATGSTE